MTSRRILLISASSPAPTTNGGNQRTRLLFDTLSKYGDVDFFLIAGDKIDDDLVANLREGFNLVGVALRTPAGKRNIFRWMRPIWPYLVDRAATYFFASKVGLDADPALSHALRCVCAARKYDFIVTRMLSSACLTDAFNQACVFVDIDDLNSEEYESHLNSPEAKGLKRSFFRRLASSYRRNEQKEIDKCCGVWVAKIEDLDKVRHDNIAILPNLPFRFAHVSKISPLPGDFVSKCVIGVGTMWHDPNREGFGYFVQHIWPRIVQSVPGARLKIVGRGVDGVRKAGWESVPGVIVRGFVEDLDAEYQEASFSIAPLFSGGGSNIKVLESMAYGRACVCSTHAARGYSALMNTNDGLLIADSLEEFVNHCVRLLSDGSLCKEIGTKAFESVQRNFSIEAFEAAVLKVLRPVLELKAGSK